MAIDEAIEAAKELCSADAPGFVNGILARGAPRGGGIGVTVRSRSTSWPTSSRTWPRGCAPAISAPSEAAELVQRSAELAARIGSELDARGRSADRLEGQERLL